MDVDVVVAGHESRGGDDTSGQPWSAGQGRHPRGDLGVNSGHLSSVSTSSAIAACDGQAPTASLKADRAQIPGDRPRHSSRLERVGRQHDPAIYLDRMAESKASIEQSPGVVDDKYRSEDMVMLGGKAEICGAKAQQGVVSSGMPPGVWLDRAENLRTLAGKHKSEASCKAFETPMDQRESMGLLPLLMRQPGAT